MTKQVTEIANLSTAAHDLMQGANQFNDAQRSRLFRTVKGMLDRIDRLMTDQEVTDEIKKALAEKNAANPGTFTFAAAELLGMNIAILQLPGHLPKTLIKNQLYTIADLSAVSKTMLAQSSDIGAAGAAEIAKALARFNLELVD